MDAIEHNKRGHQRLLEGDVDGAMRAFLDALAEDPNDVPAMLSRLEVLALHREDHVAAVAAGRVLRERGVGGVAMASAFAYSLSSIGEHAEALSAIYDGLRTAPETETLWYNAACAHAKLGQTDPLAIAIEVACALAPLNGALARDDEDFARVAKDPWFQRATDEPRAPIRATTSLRILVAGECSVGSALEAVGHDVERREITFSRDDTCLARSVGLLDGDHDRVLVVSDDSDAARATERDLSQLRGPPVAMVVPTWLPTLHLPSFHAPNDAWGPGALGMLRFFLGPLASEPPG